MKPSTVEPGKRPVLCYALAGIVLALQAAMFYMMPQPAPRTLPRPLTALPARLGDWVAVRENPLGPDVAAILKADDTVNRDYTDTAHGSSANLFIAYFGSQQQARAPHSPQHCMPGAGWEPLSLTRVTVAIPHAPPVRINRYILAKGADRVVVHYWYESNSRVIASEYLAKIYLVLDSIRYRRSDTSLVRVTVSVPNEGSLDQAVADGVRFVQASFGPVAAVLR